MKKNGLLFLLIYACLFVCGCQPGAERGGQKIICPGKSSIEEAIQLLQLQRQNLQPFLANAECTVTYHNEDGQSRNELVHGQIAFVPNQKFDFIGKLLFKELRFGTNRSEFWLRIKADIEDLGDSYWSGRRKDLAQCPGMLPINPDNIAEALGIVEVTPDWKMSYQGGYDLFTLYADGKMQKRVSINACDYRIEKVEYFGPEETRSVSVALKEYSTKENGIMVPTHIQIVSYDPAGAPELGLLFELKNIRSLPPEKIGKRLFVCPLRDGYEHMYRLDENCEFVEE